MTAIRRTLNWKAFTATLRRAVRAGLRERPALKPARVTGPDTSCPEAVVVVRAAA